MKNVLLIALLLISGVSYAQNVGIGTSNPDESAILDLQTTNKGFLLPRLTEKQKNLIPTPAEGLMIYQTDTNNQGVYLYQSGTWKNMGSGNISTSGTTANAVTAYTPNYLLTSDGSGNAISSGVYVNPASGNTGLGTSTPSQKLDVVGSIQQSAVKSSVIKVDANGKLVAAVAGTDYVAPGSAAFVLGTGTTNYLSKFSASGTVANSIVAESSSNIGIGTATPAQKLDVVGSIQQSAVKSKMLKTDADGKIVEAIAGTDYASPSIGSSIQGSGTANYLSKFSASGTVANSIVAESLSNIGIGTATPTEKLDVVGSIQQSAVKSSVVKVNGNGKFVAAVAGTDYVAPGSAAFVQGTGTTNYIPKFSASGTVANSVLAEATSNIGIGTATPAQKLDVVGSIQQSAVKSSVVKVDASGKFVAAVAGTDYVAPGSAAFVQGTGTTNFLSKFSASGTVANSIVAESSSNIGIGTATPTEKLDVVGSIQQSAVKSSVVKVNGNGKLVAAVAGTDYVAPGSAAFVQGTGTTNYIPKFSASGTVANSVLAEATSNIGIGTATPSQKLDVVGSIQQSAVKSSVVKVDASGKFVAAVAGTDYVAPGSAAFVQGTGTTNYLSKFSASGTVANSIVAESSSNIGIGTATPAQKLDVVGSIQQSAVKSSVVKVDASGKLVAAVAGTDYVAPGSAAFVQGTGTTNYLSKFSASGTVANSIVAEASSNIGIGTATPAEKLDIVGSIQQSAVKSSVIKTDGAGKLVAATAGTDYVAAGTNSVGTLAKFSATGTVANSAITEAAITNGSGVKVDSKSAGYLAIGDFGASPAMSIPSGYRLVVQDGIITEKVKVALRNSQTDWADYVFAKGYQLMPLTEVATYIQVNKHLPNVPSADEMVQNGVDVAKTSKMFMEKIEELTLYMIELKKEVEALKAENAKLRK